MAGRSASYGAWARRRADPGTISPAPSLDQTDVERNYRKHVALLIGIAMTRGIEYVDDDEDDEGNEVTLVVRQPVWLHGAEFRLKVIEAGADRIHHLTITQRGFSPFAAHVMTHDIGEDNYETCVELTGCMIAAQTLLGTSIRNPK